MPYHHFKIPCEESASAEADLNRFLAGKSVLSVERQFVASVGGAFWAYCVHVAVGAVTGSAAAAGRGGVDYREVLEPHQFAIYAALREWRKKLAEQDGTPPFAILTNEQMAEIARRGCRTVSEVKSIPGVGAGRLEKYGEAIVSVTCGAEQVGKGGQA